MANDKKRSCFVIAPIGGDTSTARRATDGLLDAVIEPTLETLDLSVSIAHRISKSGSITSQIIERLISADLVVADLTGLNPNVMYELAVRHAKRLPTVSLAEQGTKLPFDIADERTLFYVNDMAGVKDLSVRLRNAAEEALEDQAPDNPIYRAIQGAVMRDVEPRDAQGYVIERLDQLEHLIRSVREGAGGRSRVSVPLAEAGNVVNVKVTVGGTREQVERLRKLLQTLGTITQFSVQTTSYPSDLDVKCHISGGIPLVDFLGALVESGLRLNAIDADDLPF